MGRGEGVGTASNSNTHTHKNIFSGTKYLKTQVRERTPYKHTAGVHIARSTSLYSPFGARKACNTPESGRSLPVRNARSVSAVRISGGGTLLPPPAAATCPSAIVPRIARTSATDSVAADRFEPASSGVAQNTATGAPGAGAMAVKAASMADGVQFLALFFFTRPLLAVKYHRDGYLAAGGRTAAGRKVACVLEDR